VDEPYQRSLLQSFDVEEARVDPELAQFGYQSAVR
jgi:hypothetical protein